MPFLSKYALLIALYCLAAFSGFTQPANNEACNATNITVENLDCEPTTIYSWTGATYSSTNGSTYCNGPDKRDVWFKFTVPANGEAKVSTANANGFYNMATEVYKSTSCSALTLMDGNTNGFPCIYTNPYLDDPFRTFKNLIPGSIAYLRVYPLYYPDQHDGAIKICVANTSQLADEPCTAGYFPVEAADPLGQACIPYKTFSWSGATLTPGVPNPTCTGNADPATIRDVWLKIKVPASGKFVINTGYVGPYQTGIQTFSATTCNGTLTQMGCSINGQQSYSNIAPGSTVFVRLFVWSGSVIASNGIKICVSGRNDVPAVNNSDGKVGIGIDSPFTKLQVVGSGYFHDKLLAGSDLEARGNLLLKGDLISTSGSSTFNIPNLTISGNTSFSDNVNFDKPVAFTKNTTLDSLQLTSKLGARIAVYGSVSSNHFGLGMQANLLQMYADATNSNIAFGYGSSNSFTERARIINQGEFGMSVKGRLQLTTGTQSAGLWLTNNANNANASFIGMANDNQVGFYGPNGAAWGLTMNLTTSNVGIGINGANPTRPLSFPAALGEKILLYPGANGEVGIGVYGNELRLHADNPGAKVSFGTQDNAGVFTEVGKFEKNGAYGLSVFGSIWANGTTYASDGRFKKNVEPLEDALDKVLQLQGVSYQMKTEEFPGQSFDGSTQVGLIAQDVEKIVPEVVTTGPGGYKAIDYAKLVPLLIESIKAQEERIRELEKKIDQLNNKQHR